MCHWIYRRCIAHNEVVYVDPVTCSKGTSVLGPLGTAVKCPDIPRKEAMRKEYVDMICPMCEDVPNQDETGETDAKSIMKFLIGRGYETQELKQAS
jgi:hypothetical protein